MSEGLDTLIERYHQALDAFLRGDPTPLEDLYSRRDDSTLANPFGPPVRGWERVGRRCSAPPRTTGTARPPGSTGSPTCAPTT